MKDTMQKKILTVFAILFISLPAAARRDRNNSGENFTRHENPTFGISIMIPQCWKKTEADLSYKYILLFQKGTYTEIKISAIRASDELLQNQEKWNDWYIKGVGARPFEIIETGEVAIDRETKGKLLLLEYSSRGRKIVQRVLIARHKNILLTIECSGTVGQFYRYSEVFNTVMGSLIFSTPAIPKAFEKKETVEKVVIPEKQKEAEPEKKKEEARTDSSKEVKKEDIEEEEEEEIEEEFTDDTSQETGK